MSNHFRYTFYKIFQHHLKVTCCADIPTWDSVLVGKAGTVEDTKLWLDQVWTGRVLWGWESENVSAPVSCCCMVTLLHTNTHYLGGSGWGCACEVWVLRADKSHHHNTFNCTILCISINHPFTVSNLLYFGIKNLSVWWLTFISRRQILKSHNMQKVTDWKGGKVTGWKWFCCCLFLFSYLDISQHLWKVPP